MKTFYRSIVLVIFAALSLPALGQAQPEIYWGQPVEKWVMGITTTNGVFPAGFPPRVFLYLTNQTKVARSISADISDQMFKLVWSTDSGETVEKTYLVPSRYTRLVSGFDRSIAANATGSVNAWCGDILARLPPGHGRLKAFINLNSGGGWEELYSGDLELRVRPRVETDPPAIPLMQTDDEMFAAGYARVRAARAASNAAASNRAASQTSPAISATLNKCGTPNIGQKSATSASPVIATVSNGEAPGSIFTPRNIIGATVVLALLAIIASVLVHARSRQNPRP